MSILISLRFKKQNISSSKESSNISINGVAYAQINQFDVDINEQVQAYRSITQKKKVNPISQTLKYMSIYSPVKKCLF